MSKVKQDKELKNFVDEVFSEQKDPTRRILERIWYRNLLYYMGEQYIEWVISLNTFRRKPSHPFVPTPVANIIREYVDSMKALILNKDYSVRIWPNSNEREDREAAILGQQLLGHMDADNDEEFMDEMEKTIILMLLAGVGFNRTYPDMEAGDGTVIKGGDVASVNTLSFNVLVDSLGDNLRGKRYIGIKSLKSKEWVEDTFKTKITNEDDPNIINYQKRIMKLVSNVSPWKASGIESSLLDMKEEDLIIYKEMEFRPTKKRPKGRYLVQVGDQQLIDNDELPIPVKDNKWYYTLTDFHCHYIPGRFWSDPGVTDQISPQNSINAIDQALEMNRKGIGRPMVTYPTSMNIKRVNKYGQPLLILEYDALLSGGVEPKVHSGTPLPQQVLLERNIHKETAQDASGNPKAILSGKPSSGRASGIQVDILRDAAEQGHEPDIMRYFRGLKRVYKKRLILAQKLYSVKRLIKVGGRDQPIRVVSFKGADLRNNTDIRLELGNKLASTQAGRTQLMIQMQQGGFFGDLNQDPGTRQELLRRIGLGTLKDKTSVDVDRAEMENTRIIGEEYSEILVSVINPESQQVEVVQDDPLFKYDNHFIHYEIHKGLLLSMEFDSLSTKAQRVLILHTDTHHTLVQAEIALMKKEEMIRENPEMGTDVGNNQTVV